MLLAVKVTAAFVTLTRPERVKVLILDEFAGKVELMLLSADQK